MLKEKSFQNLLYSILIYIYIKAKLKFAEFLMKFTCRSRKSKVNDFNLLLIIDHDVLAL